MPGEAWRPVSGGAASHDWSASCYDVAMAILVREDGGAAPGAVYMVDGDRATMVWSPHWRGPVPQDERLTTIGTLGEGEVEGWSECCGPAPMFVSPTPICEVTAMAAADVVRASLVGLVITAPR